MRGNRAMQYKDHKVVDIEVASATNADATDNLSPYEEVQSFRNESVNMPMIKEAFSTDKGSKNNPTTNLNDKNYDRPKNHDSDSRDAARYGENSGADGKADTQNNRSHAPTPPDVRQLTQDVAQEKEHLAQKFHDRIIRGSAGVTHNAHPAFQAFTK
jgi:hypothetical protein